MKLRLVTVAFLSLLLNACYIKQEVARLAEAENLFFTDDGRLFVSSGEGFYELLKNAVNEEYQLKVISDFECAFAGITQLADTLYTVCSEIKLVNAKKHLLALDLNARDSKLLKIADISELDLPNGLTGDGESTLYLANTAYLGSGSISRITVNQKEVNSIEHNWANGNHNVFHPNGIKFVENSLWFSDGGSIKNMLIAEDENATYANQFFNRLTIYDDITPYCNGVLAADFVGGQLVYISREGEVKYKTGFASYQGASSLLVGKPPLFSSYQVVATERGILFDKQSQIGNRISTATFNFDLAQCQ
ncbi:hypothetical protein [Aliikangiella sp. G2MR2-5]|uniref:hypothetical protein n=1 Tax=Aliikangiella sp. G2MR2-5 TaxID=2788943 RepID=UPI0018AAE66A|nr:hypothetical protein [Aliikangiella sp. G2MR2-5]